MVNVEVENTGKREGQEVVQLYVRDMVSSISTPIQQLKAFKKVNLKPGEKTMVSLELPISNWLLQCIYEKSSRTGRV